jgi:hypothetical protein
MKKIAILMILLVSAAAAEPAAFVVNSLAETMSKVDLVDGGVQNHVAVLGDIPNDIDYADNVLYVVNSISADLQMIDPISFANIATYPLPVGSNPYSVEVVGYDVYITGWVSGVVYHINTVEDRIDSSIAIGGFPEGIAFSDGMIFVAQTGFNPGDFSYGQGRVAMIDAASLQYVDEINVGTNPQSIIVEPNGLIHIICTGNYADIEGSVYIFNPYSDVMQDSISIGGQPVSGIITRDGIAFVAAGGWVDHGIVMSYDIHSKQVLHGPSNPIAVGLGATDIALDSLGFIYTTNLGNDSVTKLSSDGQVLSTYHMGDGPQALVIMDDRLTDIVGNGEAPELPKLAGISSNYPNPFNANTIIRFNLPRGVSGGAIGIFDLQGRLVRHLSLGTVSGSGEVLWNGCNDAGFDCASGVYLARLSLPVGGNAETIGVTRKLALVR